MPGKFPNFLRKYFPTVGSSAAPEHVYDNNPNWWGLSSVMNRGIQGANDACPSGEGGDGFHGIANQPPQVYDR